MEESSEAVFELARTIGFEELDNRSFEMLSSFAATLSKEESEGEIREGFLEFEEGFLRLELLNDQNVPVNEITVAEHMNKNFLTVLPSESVVAFSHRILRSMVTGAPVVNAQGQLIGVVSATDFAGIISRKEFWPQIGELTVGDIMTRRPITARLSISVIELLRRMLSFRLHRIIVVNDDEVPIGLMTSLDATKLLRRLLTTYGTSEVI